MSLQEKCRHRMQLSPRVSASAVSFKIALPYLIHEHFSHDASC